MSTAGKIISTAAGVVASLAVTGAEPPQIVAPIQPTVIRFDPSQRRLFDDDRRVIVVNWHRQKGKDFTAAAKAVEHAMRTGQTWYIVAMTQAQADETFAKCKLVAEAYKRLLRIVANLPEDETEEFVDLDKEINHAFRHTSRTLHLPGGGKVVSLPGRNVDTLAGRSGNMIFTEFGLYPKGGHVLRRCHSCKCGSDDGRRQTAEHALFVASAAGSGAAARRSTAAGLRLRR